MSQLLLDHKRLTHPNTLVSDSFYDAMKSIGIDRPEFHKIDYGGMGFGGRQTKLLDMLLGKKISKVVPNWKDIVKSGTGFNLLFRQASHVTSTTIARGKLVDGKWVESEILKHVIHPEKDPISRAVLSHETFHRVSAKYYNSFLLKGKTSGPIGEITNGAQFSSRFLASGNFPEEILAYSMASRGFYGHSSEIAQRVSAHPFWGKFVDPRTNQFSYLKMKGYLGEAVGKTHYYKNFLSGVTAKAMGSGLMKFGKKGIVALALASSLLFGGTAYAHNIVPVGKNISAVERTTHLRSLTNYIASRTDKGSKSIGNTSNLLYETAIHESMRLKASRQIAKGGKPGRARSIFMVEPVTAQNLVKWAANKPQAMSLLTTASGLTAKELTAMTRKQLADYMMQHDHFAAALARIKYLSVPGKIPSTREARAAYWSKWYQGTNNPVKQQQYIRDSRLMAEEVKASTLSKVVQKHIVAKPTQGLVNKVLHENKVMHNVASKTKKASRMWQILGRR